MRSVRPRLPCPVCLGVAMDKCRPDPLHKLEVDRCSRCGGVWFERGEVQQLRALQRDTVTQVLNAYDLKPTVCHDCHAPLERNAQSCASCGWTNQLSCPSCAKRMKVETHTSLRLDVCHACNGVWFDHAELEALWTQAFDAALHKRHLPPSHATDSVRHLASDVTLHMLLYAPDVVAHGVMSAAQIADVSAATLSGLPDAVAATPEAAGLIVESAAEAAESVFDVIVNIITGIFDGF